MRSKQYRIRLHFQSNKGVEPPSLRGFLVLELSTEMTDFDSCLAGVDDRAQPARLMSARRCGRGGIDCRDVRDGYARVAIMKEMIDETITCTLHRKITFLHAEIQEQTQT